MKPVRFNSQELVKNLTVEIVLEKRRWFDLRITIGLNLIRLGAFVAGLGYETSEKVDNG